MRLVGRAGQVTRVGQPHPPTCLPVVRLVATLPLDVTADARALIGGGDAPAQYSGWLFLYSEVAGGLRGPARADVAALLGPGPRADLAAIRARLTRQVDRRLFAVGQRVYDRYLKANRIEAGTASYAEVVRLVLGTRFGKDWTPVLR